MISFSLDETYAPAVDASVVLLSAGSSSQTSTSTLDEYDDSLTPTWAPLLEPYPLDFCVFEFLDSSTPILRRTGPKETSGKGRSM
jgi:hypothetical protein